MTKSSGLKEYWRTSNQENEFFLDHVTMNSYIEWCVDNAQNRRLQSTSGKFLVDMEIQSINRPHEPDLKWYWLEVGAEGRGPYDYPRFNSDEEELEFLNDRKHEVRAAVTERVKSTFYKATVCERAIQQPA